MEDESKPDPSTPKGVDSKQSVVHFSKIDYTAAQHSRFYANHVAANSTLFDMRLIFSDVDVKNDGVLATHVLTVLMSPELAQLVHTILGKTLDNYTKAYGQTRVPVQLATGTVETNE